MINGVHCNELQQRVTPQKDEVQKKIYHRSLSLGLLSAFYTSSLIVIIIITNKAMNI